MIVPFKRLYLLILLVTCVYFMRAEPLERTWITTCRVLNCQLPLDICVQTNCLGKESCLECISSLFPSCVDCSNQIIASAINDQQNIVCNQNEPLHLSSCSFFCRSMNMISSSCGITNGLPLCSCSEYQNGTFFTTATTKTTTKTQSTTQPTPPSFLPSPYIKYTLNNHTDQILHVVQKANGEVVTFSKDKTLKFWDINDFRLLKTIDVYHPYESVNVQNHIFYNNSDLIYLSKLSYVVVMNLETGELKKSYNVVYVAHSLLLLSNGNLAVGCNDGRIRILNINSDSISLVKTLVGHTSYVMALVELPNKDLASIQRDGMIYYWNINGDIYFFKQVGNPSYAQDCMILLNQNEIAICSNGNILVFDINSANVKYSITSSLNFISRVNQLPNQRLFVQGTSGSSGYSVLDLQQRKELKHWKNIISGYGMFVNSSSVDMVTTSGFELQLWKIYLAA